MRGRHLGQKQSVVHDPREFLLVDVVERIRQRHVAFAVVVAVRLAVGGDVDELRVRRPFLECAEQTMGKILAAPKQALEGDGARDRPVVEEEIDRAPGGEVAAVRHGRIDRAGLLGPVVISHLPPP